MHDHDVRPIYDATTMSRYDARLSHYDARLSRYVMTHDGDGCRVTMHEGCY